MWNEITSWEYALIGKWLAIIDIKRVYEGFHYVEIQKKVYGDGLNITIDRSPSLAYPTQRNPDELQINPNPN
jgi:hypothetical protein